jgi:hypothetical protein
MRNWVLILLVFTLSSCEKDEAIDTKTDPATLAHYLSEYHADKTSNKVWLHAGNHPSFERETDERPIHIRLFAPERATEFTCFLNDSIQFRDSLRLYRKISAEFQMEREGLFGLFAIKESRSELNRYARVSYVLGDSLYLSEPILIRAKAISTDTKNTADLRIEVTSGGRAFMNWTASDVAQANNLVMITDRTGLVFCAAQTKNDEFLFYNLRNVNRNFTPDLFDPRLVHGETYGLRIYSTDNSGWMRNFRSVVFRADSLNIQSFD